MAKLLNADAHVVTLGDIAASASPEELENYKIDRLLELRAVIDSLRHERAALNTSPYEYIAAHG